MCEKTGKPSTSEDEAYLKDLIQFAKERNVLALVMDAKSTSGETKKMVRCAMKHAGYQGSMT